MKKKYRDLTLEELLKYHVLVVDYDLPYGNYYLPQLDLDMEIEVDDK